MFNRFLQKRRMSRGMEIEDSVFTVTEKEEAILETPFEQRGLSFFWYSVVLVIVVLFGRVFYLDFVQGSYFSDVSKDNRIRKIVIKAPRGTIFDRHGTVLVRNIPSIDAVIIPYYLPDDPAERKRIAATVAETVEMNSGNVEVILESQTQKSLDPILLKENISQEQALILMERERELPGIVIERTAIRSYENSVIFSPLIGYDGKITREEMSKNEGYIMTDYIGKTGVEKSYEKYLHGRHGARQVEIDSKGNIKKYLGIIEAQSGNDLVLNIDEGLQKKLYDSMTATLEKTETKTATAVAIDPRTGGILAMVSIPSYDNNMFAKGISNDEYKMLIEDKDLPLLNRAINGEYPPGSTLKPVIAAAALSEGTISPETVIDSLGGVLRVGGFSFRDWKTHGPSDVRTAIAESNDIFFYTIGGGYGNVEGLGVSRMKKYNNLFGFGEPTGIDILGESSGFIPDEEWKQRRFGEKWYIGNSYHASIGQGYVTATPLQLANMTAAIANGGTLYAPRVVSRIKKESGEETIEPEVIRKDFVAGDVIRVVREGMRQAVTDGTAQPLKTLPVAVAGKTGTAQFGSEDKTHAWFISFAPFDNPEIAMVVLMEGAGEGHSSSVPVTKEALEWYFSNK